MLTVLFFTFLAAFIPAMIYIAILWWLDRYEREPLWLMSVTFLWGAIPAVIVTLIFHTILDIPMRMLVEGDFGRDFAGAAIIAPFVEEIAKAIPILAIFVLYRKEFDGIMDGLIYGSLVGFGFAMTENMLYFFGAYSEGGWGGWGAVVFLRAVVFGLNHALFSSMFGAALGYARYTTNRALVGIVPLLGLGAAMFLHMVHNAGATLAGTTGLALCVVFISDYGGVLLWLLLVYASTRKEKQWITEELAEEVQAGLLSPAHAAAAASYRARLRERGAAMSARGRGYAGTLNRMHQLATELAFKKRQYRIHGDKHGTGEEIQRLRARIWELSHQLR